MSTFLTQLWQMTLWPHQKYFSVENAGNLIYQSLHIRPVWRSFFFVKLGIIGNMSLCQCGAFSRLKSIAKVLLKNVSFLEGLELQTWLHTCTGLPPSHWPGQVRVLKSGRTGLKARAPLTRLDHMSQIKKIFFPPQVVGGAALAHCRPLSLWRDGSLQTDHFALLLHVKGSVERSRHERHFCSLLSYLLLSLLQIFQIGLSFWTSSLDLVLF